jgi:uncharacterized protein involved in response to NO
VKVELLVSHWCPTCPAAEAVWRQVAAERDVAFAVVDLSRPEGRELAARLHVRSVPSTVVDGVLASVGVPAPDEARALIAAAPPRTAAARSAPAAVAGRRATWRDTLALLAAAPHRAFFLLGATQAVVAMIWWLLALAARHGVPAPPFAWSIPPGYAHGFVLVYGMFPAFVIGFLMASVPAWTGLALPRRLPSAAAALMALGTIATYAAFMTDARLAASAMAVHVAGWLAAVASLATLVAANRGRDRYALGLVVLLAAGALGEAAFGIGAWRGDALMPAALHAGLWLFLLPVFLTAEHRLVPFIAGRTIAGYVVFRPRASLPLMLAGAAAHFALDALDAGAWRWLVDAPMAAWAAVLALRWGLRRAFHAPLAAMLHVGLLAFAAAMALYAADSAAALAGRAGLFGQAPLHLLAVGYMAATTVAMVTRVSLAQAGRSLDAERVVLGAFGALLAAAALRAAADLWFVPPAAHAWLAATAAAVWTIAMLAWAWRYAPLYLRARADGLPG